MKNETILTVRTIDVLKQLEDRTGLVRLPESLLDDAPLWLGPRAALEDDPTFLQIIPYTIFRHQGHVLLYQRAAATEEKRLAAKWSIGIGGHINVNDVHAVDGEIDLDRTVRQSTWREIEEELKIRPSHRREFLGWLYDPVNPVGRVHLGRVIVMELADRAVQPESTIAHLSFAELSEVAAFGDGLENWSRICVKHLMENR